MTNFRAILIRLLIIPIAFTVLSGPAHAADSFERYLEENTAAKALYEDANLEQQQGMILRWIIYNERHNDFSLEEQQKIEAMRKEREKRWSRLSEHEKMKVLDNKNLNLE